MVPNILQLILVFRTGLKLLLHFVLILPSVFPKHLLLHCANVTFLLVQSRVFFFAGITSPHLLAAPCTQALSKVPLLPLPTTLHPNRNMAPFCQPTVPGRKLTQRHALVTPTGTSCSQLPAADRSHGTCTTMDSHAGGHGVAGC